MATFQRILWSFILLLQVGVLGLKGYAQGHEPYVHFVATPQPVVMEMLKMARVTQNDILYDLGCGDGRIVITAAKVFGSRGVGVDIDPVLIQESQENARKAGVTDRVKFIQQDLFQTDISEATVVTLYLLPDLNLKLRPKLFKELKPGTRIVSHEFDMGDWKYERMGTVYNSKIYYNFNVPDVKDLNFYYWVIPANAAGEWQWTMSRSPENREYILRIGQKFQEISGRVKFGKQESPIEEALLAGDQLSFMFREEVDGQKVVMRFNGRISQDTIQGNVEVQGGPLAGDYQWNAKRNF
ncbi:MAG: methyltransferase domain-containing protein [Deltaproteobacteria bacterium]|nr:methyltransferase domain-containing protein [Deltaproteobacteria bacterium]